jgi:hypothetical protein
MITSPLRILRFPAQCYRTELRPEKLHLRGMQILS